MVALHIGINTLILLSLREEMRVFPSNVPLLNPCPEKKNAFSSPGLAMFSLGILPIRNSIS